MKGMATKLHGQSVDDLSAPVNDGAAKFVSNFTKRNYSLKSIFKKKCVNDTDKCKEILIPRTAFVDSDPLKGNVVNFTFSSETNVKNAENALNVRSRSVSPLPRKTSNDYSSVSNLCPPVENEDELTPNTHGDEKSQSRFFTSHLVSDDESTPQTQNLSTTFLEEMKISAR
jgi:hypothetical protein